MCVYVCVCVCVCVYGEKEEEKEEGEGEGKGRTRGIKEEGKGWFSAFNEIRVKRGSHIIMRNYKHLSVPSIV